MPAKAAADARFQDAACLESEFAKQESPAPGAEQHAGPTPPNYRHDILVIGRLFYRGGATLPGWIEMLAVSLKPSMVIFTGTLSPLVTPGGTVTSI